MIQTMRQWFMSHELLAGDDRWLLSRKTCLLQSQGCEHESVHQWKSGVLQNVRRSLWSWTGRGVQAVGAGYFAEGAARGYCGGQHQVDGEKVMKRLKMLRNNLALVTTQIDALQITELDKELMQTLWASSAAVKKAGAGKGVKEAGADARVRRVDNVQPVPVSEQRSQPLVAISVVVPQLLQCAVWAPAGSNRDAGLQVLGGTVVFELQMANDMPGGADTILPMMRERRLCTPQQIFLYQG